MPGPVVEQERAAGVLPGGARRGNVRKVGLFRARDFRSMKSVRSLALASR